MYILKINNSFIKLQSDEILITKDISKATQFELIGNAMKIAVKIDFDLDCAGLVKAIKI